MRANVFQPFFRLVWFWFYWGLTPQQQPGSYQGGEMMMKAIFLSYPSRRYSITGEQSSMPSVIVTCIYAHVICQITPHNLLSYTSV